MLYIYIYIYIDIVPDVPDTSGESKNNIGPPSGGPKNTLFEVCQFGYRSSLHHIIMEHIPYSNM